MFCWVLRWCEGLLFVSLGLIGRVFHDKPSLAGGSLSLRRRSLFYLLIYYLWTWVFYPTSFIGKLQRLKADGFRRKTRFLHKALRNAYAVWLILSIHLRIRIFYRKLSFVGSVSYTFCISESLSTRNSSVTESLNVLCGVWEASHFSLCHATTSSTLFLS